MAIGLLDCVPVSQDPPLLLCVVSRSVKSKADNADDSAYDRAARELVFEAKGQVGACVRVCVHMHVFVWMGQG